MTNWIENIRWNVDGLLPVIVQEVGTAKIIMFAWMNRETLEESIKQKKAIYSKLILPLMQTQFGCQ